MSNLTTIIIPRGNNIGTTIKNHFANFNQLQFSIKDVYRDTKNRCNVAVVSTHLKLN